MGFEVAWWIYLPGCEYIYITLRFEALSIVTLTTRARAIHAQYFPWGSSVCIHVCTSIMFQTDFSICGISATCTTLCMILERKNCNQTEIHHLYSARTHAASLPRWAVDITYMRVTWSSVIVVDTASDKNLEMRGTWDKANVLCAWFPSRSWSGQSVLLENWSAT